MLSLRVAAAPPKEEGFSTIVASIAAAKSEYHAPPASSLKNTRDELKLAVGRLNVWIKARGAENEPAWRTQLGWEQLEKQLALEIPQPKELEGVLARFETGSAGLELKPLSDVRTALRAFLTQSRYAAASDLKAEYRARLDELAVRLPAYEQSLSQADADKIGETLAWLEGANLAPELTAAIRQRHCHENIRAVLILKPDFIRESLPLDDSALTNVQRSRNTILGTDTVSTVRTTAELATALADNSTKGEIRLNFNGTATCRDTVGRNGPATIYSHGQMRLHATQAVTIDRDGLHAEMLGAGARVRTEIDDIEMSNLVFKKLTTIVAKKKVASKKEEAEEEAGRLAARQFRQQIEKQTAAPLAVTQAFYQSWLRDPLERVGMFPDKIDFRSKQESMELTASLRLGEKQQLGGHKPLPKLGYHNASVIFHQSFFNNAPRGWIHPGTSLVRDDEIERLLHFLVGRVPRELRVYTGKPRWSMMLAARPFEVSIDNGKMHLTLVLDGLRQQGQTSPPLRATGLYVPEITRFGPQFNRQGSLNIVFQGDIAPELRAVVEAKLDALMAESIRLDGLIAPHGGSFEVLSELQLKEMICDDGVFGIGYEQIPD